MKGAFAAAALVAATASFQGADAFVGPILKGTCWRGAGVEWDFALVCRACVRLEPVVSSPLCPSLLSIFPTYLPLLKHQPHCSSISTTSQSRPS